MVFISDSINLGPINLVEFTEAVQSENPDKAIKKIFEKHKNYPEENNLEECKQIGRFCLEAKQHKANESKLDGWYYSYRHEVFNELQFDLIKFGKNDVLVNIEIKRQMPENRGKVLTQGKSHYRFLKASLLRYFKNKGKKNFKVEEHLYVYEIILNEGIYYRIVDENEPYVIEDYDSIINSLPDMVSNAKSNLDAIFSRENLPRSFTQNWEDMAEGLYMLSDSQMDKKNKIKDSITESKSGLYSITGDAGTGKSLLLFDLAKDFSQNNEKVALFCKNGDRLPSLNSSLKTFSFSGLRQLDCNAQVLMDMKEGHNFFYPIVYWPYMNIDIDSKNIDPKYKQAPAIIKIAYCDTFLCKKADQSRRKNQQLRENSFKRYRPFIQSSNLGNLIEDYLQFILNDYKFILVDEAQCLTPAICKTLMQMEKNGKFIIFCYDQQQIIMPNENCASILNTQTNHQFKLATEIRQKLDIHDFCEKVANGRLIDIKKHKNVEIKKVSNSHEKEGAIKEYIKRDYAYLCPPSLLKLNPNGPQWENRSSFITGIGKANQMTTENVLGDDYDKVVIDIDWILENHQDEALDKNGCLYINMTRAKSALCLVTSNIELLNAELHLYPPLKR